ncbi:MAG: hypothetical protein QXT13_10310 [Pyrobaculum sp.]
MGYRGRSLIQALHKALGEKEAGRIYLLYILLQKHQERNKIAFSEGDIKGLYKRGHKGHLKRMLEALREAGFLELVNGYYVLTPLALKLLDPPGDGLELYIAGNKYALEQVSDLARSMGWLVGAGVFWDGKFNEQKAVKMRAKVGKLFLDSGAQQFYRKFKGFDYPYRPGEYLDFAMRIGADLIATLDLPLDILAPRGLPVKEGIKKTVEYGVEIYALAEKLGAADRIVPVLQGYDDPSQWLESLDLYRSHGIKAEVWGLGSLCMMSRPKLARRIVETVRRALPGVKLHVFGVDLNVLKRIYCLVDSYDTSAWVFWAKRYGTVRVWDPFEESFVKLKPYVRYPTKRLFRLNFYELLKFHEHLVARKRLCKNVS